MWIPEGFAHGFLVLSEQADFLYKTTNFYSPKHEHCIIWSDSTLNIKWPLNFNIQQSPKDLDGQAFRASELFP